MTETSREYWRSPDKYHQNVHEKNFGRPEFYLDSKFNAISEQIVEMLDAVGADKSWRILEVGCNCGRNIKFLLQAGYENVEGVEINPEAVEVSWEEIPHVARRIQVADAQSFLAMKPPNSYDLIYTQSILMHVPPEDDYLFKQMSRVASKMLFVSEVEIQVGNLRRHKYDRNYKDVFERLGWRQVLVAPNNHRIMRVFVK